ncbi:MAG: polysaccharide biosynthesis/export family protein [Pasteurella oralis]|uniref:polysaccharide biosynthesis/export family protein n=1 Tax=Pasteurella oralis TaxID=1071947 RepID=UPI0026F6F55F|nr:polysaccharide biosynthesis/export family protein [Pasteurella oralis]
MKLTQFFSLSLVSASLLTACHLAPTSGPSQSAVIEMGQADEQSAKIPDVDVIEMDDNIANMLFNQRQSQSFTHFAQKKANYSGVVNIGDTLDVLIWEAAPAVLFGNVLTENGGGANLTTLPEQIVNKAGKITVPFLGPIVVKGKTTDQIQAEIANRLAPMANQPQALVKLNKNNTANVSVIRQGNSIRMPLTSQGERVLDAIAAVGGSPESLEDISVQLTRGNQVKTLALEKIISTPRENIELRAGDVLTLFNTPLSFTGLGAVGENKKVKFSANGMTLAEGIGQMGGLIDSRSDPKGVFIFRHLPYESLDLYNQQVWRGRGYGKGMTIPTVYRINLLEPKSLFWLQRIPLKDKDIVYVSNAPLAELQKFLNIIFSVTSPTTSTIRAIK